MNRTDMHPADIIAQLKKRNLSLAAVSRQAGLSSSTLANTLSRPWPKGEFLIAQALGIDPAEIWPSRYFDREGNPIDRKKLIRDRHE
ncbi:helix-turn-helix domain-containing protein [Klebsiella electrica]|uniref:helix-turn-helix domain-containing protein n=1 Tax=Klebsiella electrica TaxID=1259973 RepID=UPI001152CFBB|nr:helix-turn-helix transcriptional regulator [Klebsiella electrica]QDI10498.1 DNA-binding transcriptional regulator Nlp [Klebsiella electrica]